MPKKNIINLSQVEIEKLYSIIKTGSSKARVITRAHVLLMTNEGETDKAIAQRFRIHVSTVERTRTKYYQGGIELAINDRPHPPKKRKLCSEQEEILVATISLTPPPGKTHWTMQLLAEHLVSLGMVDSISDETVRSYLKKRRACKSSLVRNSK
jgi:transposase